MICLHTLFEYHLVGRRWTRSGGIFQFHMYLSRIRIATGKPRRHNARAEDRRLSKLPIRP